MKRLTLLQIATKYQHRAALAHRWTRYYTDQGKLAFASAWQRKSAYESYLAQQALFMLLEHR